METRIILHTSRLGKVQAFYAAIGVNWDGGNDKRFDDSFKPNSAFDYMGLPFLIGDLGSLQLNVYFRESVTALEIPSTELAVIFPEIGDSNRTIERLKAAGLLDPAPDFDQFTPKVRDPDGRSVILCDPSPFIV